MEKLIYSSRLYSVSKNNIPSVVFYGSRYLTPPSLLMRVTCTHKSLRNAVENQMVLLSIISGVSPFQLHSPNAAELKDAVLSRIERLLKRTGPMLCFQTVSKHAFKQSL